MPPLGVCDPNFVVPSMKIHRAGGSSSGGVLHGSSEGGRSTRVDGFSEDFTVVEVFASFTF